MAIRAPDYEELLDVCARYVQIEQGDTNYEVASGWVELHWGDSIKVAGGLRILEETWNRGFYSYGIFDVGLVIETIKQNKAQLQSDERCRTEQNPQIQSIERMNKCWNHQFHINHNSFYLPSSDMTFTK